LIMTTISAAGETAAPGKDRLIIALDHPSEDAALDLVHELRRDVWAFKVGLELFTACGPSVVRRITENGDRVFLDLKFHDIPNTVAGAAASATRLGVWMFNVHASGGTAMMKRAVESSRETSEAEGRERALITAVTILTSSAGSRDGGEVKKEVIELAMAARGAGLDGVVASAAEASDVRSATDTDFVIVTPGIRPLGATNDDQKRVMTPGEAVSAGADYLVIGRPISRAQHPLDVVRSITNEIETVLR
jgi:orotidine-5'-phosphate decarboxylase